MNRNIGLLILMLIFGIPVSAQIGEHRNDLAIGFNGGYMMSSVGFTPEVQQKQHGGLTGGFSMRYTCEKYFKTICSIYAEVNYAQAGWEEDILDKENNPVIITETKEAMAYKRTINYIQVPIFAHLAWGRETRGLNIFVNAGPQFGLYLSDSQKTNFSVEHMPATDNNRVSPVVAQDTMAVKNKLDYVSPWVWVLNTVFRRWGISLPKPDTTMVWEISTVLLSVIISERVTTDRLF